MRKLSTESAKWLFGIDAALKFLLLPDGSELRIAVGVVAMGIDATLGLLMHHRLIVPIGRMAGNGKFEGGPSVRQDARK